MDTTTAAPTVDDAEGMIDGLPIAEQIQRARQAQPPKVSELADFQAFIAKRLADGEHPTPEDALLAFRTAQLERYLVLKARQARIDGEEGIPWEEVKRRRAEFFGEPSSVAVGQ